jgi:hypothetical protein
MFNNCVLFVFSYSLTLIDALDTLLVREMPKMFCRKPVVHVLSEFFKSLFYILFQVMGNRTEFVRVADILIETLDFNLDINVSVFETNIRGVQ